MPARADVVFDAFHFHTWRARWDSLVRDTRVVGGAPCPFVGAVTENTGRDWMRPLSMRTRFVSFDRPHVAAAAMIGTSFPFARWAASMQHRPIDDGRSTMIYTYNFDVAPKAMRWLVGPIVDLVFVRQTKRRFRRLQRFLGEHAGEVMQWQQRSP